MQRLLDNTCTGFYTMAVRSILRLQEITLTLLGVESIPVAILPSCQDMKMFAI